LSSPVSLTKKTEGDSDVSLQAGGKRRHFGANSHLRGLSWRAANAAIEYKFTVATAAELNYTETEAELDAAVGIKDYAIYDFSSVTFPRGIHGTERSR